MGQAIHGSHQCILGQHFTREQGTDKSTDAPKNESDETLSRAARALAGFIIDVELPSDEEEVITRAVQEDGGCLLYTSPSPRDRG